MTPHLASFACGGRSAVVPGVNRLDAASYLNTAYPHPWPSANRLVSFSMNSTSLRVPVTVSGVLAEKGASVIFFGVHSILAILEPSGKGLPLPGEPSLYALIMTGFATITLITF